MLNPFILKQKSLFRKPGRLICSVVGGVLVLSIVATGCGGGAKQVSAGDRVGSLIKKGIRPNEMGMVMILEYHRISDMESDFVRRTDNFRADLETLYQKGYRLADLENLLKGQISVPAGTTPVIFSFDDSTVSQFRYVKQGAKTVIDPQCALGIMYDFQKKHPDFGYTAIFNYLPGLFDQPQYKKQKADYLANHGFELGNHTVTHASLGRVSDDQVQQEIAQPVADIKKINPRVKVDVLCLPNGSMPKNQSLMFDGSSRGIKYHNNWVLLVGAEPMYPQYHYKNPGKLLPRVQAMDYDREDGSGVDGSGYWLQYFDRHPELRFISDGDPTTICAPAYMEMRLLPGRLPSNVRFAGY